MPEPWASRAFAHVTDDPCPECAGTGVHIDHDDREHECVECCGTGWVLS